MNMNEGELLTKDSNIKNTNQVQVLAVFKKHDTYDRLDLVYPDGTVESSRLDGIETVFTDNWYNRDSQVNSIQAILERFNDGTGYSVYYVGCV
jgi:hypothetical protein